MADIKSIRKNFAQTIGKSSAAKGNKAIPDKELKQLNSEMKKGLEGWAPSEGAGVRAKGALEVGALSKLAKEFFQFKDKSAFEQTLRAAFANDGALTTHELQSVLATARTTHVELVNKGDLKGATRLEEKLVSLQGQLANLLPTATQDEVVAMQKLREELKSLIRDLKDQRWP
jgi:hypothetical protein